MIWNIAPECISTIVLSIIWIYSRKSNVAPNLKNNLFQLCLLSTFLAMTSNILSTLLIYELNSIILIPAWICNTIYFITTPLMGAVYYLYVVAIIYEERKMPKKIIIVTILPAIFYILLVICNPWTHWIYSLSLAGGYQKGILISSTYIIFYLYCFFSIFLVLTKGKNVDKFVRKILFSFPVVAALVIIVQQIDTSIILSGSAATISLLIIYLYMQNKQISIDHLTNLPNRQEFLSYLDWGIRSRISSFTVIVVSLLDFKRINDIYGQRVGDYALLLVGEFLKQELQLSEQQLFRYSGDEFAIIKTDASEHDVQSILQVIQARMKKAWENDSYTYFLNVALAIVSYPSSANTKEEIVNAIDFSINLAKQDSSSQYICYCTPDILNKVRRKQAVSDILLDCLQHHTFEVYYQPIYDIKRKKFTSAEALLRIPNSPLGPIYPDEFIPVAEESGLIIDITYHVLDEVCHIIQQMKEQQIMIDNINVNFSTLQFKQPDLMEHVITILKEHDVEGSNIKIEITESTLSENVDSMMRYALLMQGYGMKLAIDDFGTGYSNTQSVITLPVDIIKFDKSLIWSAMKNKHSAIIVKNLAGTFRDLGYTVLAEGVETKEHVAFAYECGCTLMQGFLYSKPLPKTTFLDFIKQNILTNNEPMEL